ncbi:MG2 domain-containing protein, partial [bacterium]|nr:MG2 domain-containing protein [bacterium]
FEVEHLNQNKVFIVVQKLLSQKYRFFVNFAEDSRDFYRYSDVISNKEIILTGQKNSKTKILWKLSDLMNERDGIFKVSVYAKKSGGKVFLDSRLFNVSDIAVSALLSDQELLIMSQSIASSKAISNAIVKVYSSNNQLIQISSSDQDGLCLVSLPKNQQKAFSIVVSYEKEKAFLLLDNPISKSKKNLSISDQFKAHIHLERSLLRPSETISGVISIKDRNYQSIQFPVKLIVKNPRGVVVQEEVLHMNEGGVAEIRVQSENHWYTGHYKAEVLLGNQVLGKKSFQVETFLPPKIKNTIEMDSKQYIANDFMDLKLRSKYYFGSPASGLKSNVKISAFAGSNQLKSWPNYSFGDHRMLRNNSDHILKSYPFITSKTGEIELTLHLKLNKTSGLPLEGLVSFSCFDDGKEVNSFQNFSLYPNKRMIGIQTLFKSNVKSSKDHQFKVLLINPITKESYQETLELKVYKSVWH